MTYKCLYVLFIFALLNTYLGKEDLKNMFVSF